MKSSSLSLILSMNVLFLPACGGGGSDATAVSSSPASPAAAATTPTSPAPTNPTTPSLTTPSTPTSSASPVAGIALAGGYPQTSLTCSQGTPMYWTREWTVLFNGGVFRFTPGVGTAREHVWNAAPQSGQAQGAATYRATTVDGGIAWITVTGSATVVGAGYTGPSSDIRCGTERDGQPMEAAQRIPATCQIGPASGRISFDTNFTLDRSAFPWKTLAVDPNADLITDATGAAVAGARIGTRPNDGDGDVEVRVGGNNEFDSTYYQFQPSGDLALARRPSRHSGLPDMVCRVR